MSLIDQYKDECVLLTKSRTADGLGGYKTAWVDDVKFFPAWEYLSSSEMVLAEQQGTNRVYRIYIPKSMNMDYHEAFRRLSDGQVFRVINPGTDRQTPGTSSMNMRVVEVEKWELPNEVE